MPTTTINIDASSKVDKNTAITGATKTKITYDSKGLVTSGADATTADITTSTDKRYLTDAQLVVVGNTSGTNTGDQTLVGLGGVAANTAITGATKTKITYDAKGLVTAGADLISTDIPNITESQVTNLVTDLAAKVPYTGATSDVNIGTHTIIAHSLKSDASDGVLIEAANGTDVGIFGAGNTNNSTLYGGLNIGGNVSAANLSGTNTGDQTLSGLGGVAANTAIVGATKTKITYDAKGLVTVGADATTADIAASTNKNYVTDAQATVIGNTSGTNTGDQTTITGNAGSATILQTARTINGTSFDGSANIVLTKRVLALSANSATPTINTNSYDVVHITSQSANITSFTTNLSGTAVDGDTLRISVKDTGTPITIAWGASFENGADTLPTVTVASTRLDIGFFWNTETTKWRCMAKG